MKPAADDNEVWINPVGGLGDTLMLSGVLKLVVDLKNQKFNLVRRTGYSRVLRGHPALGKIGHPDREARIMGTDYWSPKNTNGRERAFQVLARMFGLPLPVEEKLYLPGVLEDDPLLEKTIPWRGRNVIIAPFSDSPRKAMSAAAWARLAELLSNEGVLVMQAGRANEMHIQNAYSLAGLTTPRQLIHLLGKCDAVVASDNFVMHAAHLAGRPAVVLWGPTDPAVYGYAGQVHLRAWPGCELYDDCIGPHCPSNYGKPCPLRDGRCMDRIPLEEIHAAITGLLA